MAIQASSLQPREIAGPTSPQSHLLGNRQRYLLVPHFTLESGIQLSNVPVAFKTWGKLDPVSHDNVLVVCHALTGSADVEDWWGPLLGPDKLFDPTRYFIICCNVLGSPYGSASPCTRSGGESTSGNSQQDSPPWDGTGWWGPNFPHTTVRDDVHIHKLVLDFLGVQSVAAVVGGSMGGMAVLEWPLCFPSQPDSQQPYIRNIVPIATSARHSAWCISWSEAQRQSIYADPAFQNGDYTLSNPPRNGLSAARMAALLTYRSRDSFESRFGRRIGGNPQKAPVPAPTPTSLPLSCSTTQSSADTHLNNNDSSQPPLTNIFSAQSYLRYQGEKFVSRFDANCYIHLTRKMDSHDVSLRRRHPPSPHSDQDSDHHDLSQVLSSISSSGTNVLVVSIESDGLFTPSEQLLIHNLIPSSEFVSIKSPDGHDGFLLEFEQINLSVGQFLLKHLQNSIYDKPCLIDSVSWNHHEQVKESVFGEVEDITRW